MWERNYKVEFIKKLLNFNFLKIIFVPNWRYVILSL